MSIKGISEVVRLPRLGKIRLGIREETGDGVEFPTPTDYFVSPDEVRQVFGEKPKELRIMFPTEDESQWASQFLRCYSATRGLICRGDGERALARIDKNTGKIALGEAVETELKEIICRPDNCSYYERGQCRRVMNLQFLLPDCGGFGVYQLDTSSFHSIVNINSTITLIRGVCGRLAMIPLCLGLVEQEVQPEGKPKIVWVLNLSVPYTLAEIQRYARIPVGQSLLLPPPDSEAPDDLYPQEPSAQENAAVFESQANAELADIWEKVKRKINQLDVQDAQISIWFLNNYDLYMVRADFNASAPPAKLNYEKLSRFYDAMESYDSRR